MNNDVFDIMSSLLEAPDPEGEAADTTEPTDTATNDAAGDTDAKTAVKDDGETKTDANTDDTAVEEPTDQPEEEAPTDTPDASDPPPSDETGDIDPDPVSPFSNDGEEDSATERTRKMALIAEYDLTSQTFRAQRSALGTLKARGNIDDSTMVLITRLEDRIVADIEQLEQITRSDFFMNKPVKDLQVMLKSFIKSGEVVATQLSTLARG